MTNRRVRFTETARDHVTLEGTWWLKNRDHQALFAARLTRVIDILATRAQGLRIWSVALTNSGECSCPS